MFCRLYELKVSTGIDLDNSSDDGSCKESCIYCNSGSCDVSDDYNKSLSNDKFGWRINTRIKLHEPTKVQYFGYMTHAIQLIHPTNSDVWICRGLKKDNETEVYTIYFDGKQRESFKNIDDMNEIVNKKYYTGRNLKKSDFKE